MTSAECERGRHMKCTVAACKCPCHTPTREFRSWDDADVHRQKTGLPMRWQGGTYYVGGIESMEKA